MCLSFPRALLNFFRRVVSSTGEDVKVAIQNAQAAFESGVWSKASVIHRSQVLSNLARALERRTPEFAQMESLQTGRTIRELNAQLGRIPEWLYVRLCRTLCPRYTLIPATIMQHFFEQ